MTPREQTAQNMSKAIGAPISTEGADRLFRSIICAVSASFGTSETAMRGDASRAEITRRTDLAYEIVRKLMHDHKWSTIKVADHLTEYLRCEILGVSYAPPPAPSNWVKR